MKLIAKWQIKFGVAKFMLSFLLYAWLVYVRDRIKLGKFKRIDIAKGTNWFIYGDIIIFIY
jgi:hypothetical protein